MTLVSHIPIQFPATVPGKVVNDGPSSWIHATDAGDLDEVLAS